MGYGMCRFLIGALAVFSLACGDSRTSKSNPPGTSDELRLPVDSSPPPSEEDSVIDEDSEQDDHQGSNVIDVAELEKLDPERKSLKIFDGHDPAMALENLMIPDPSQWQDESCSIYIIASFENDEGIPSYAVRSSFSHLDDRPPVMFISVGNPDSKLLLGGSLSERDQISFDLKVAGDIESAYLVRIKWFHINHYDFFVCEDLTLRN